MKNINGNWSGRITGTNAGNVFIELQQNDSKLNGIARINDTTFGVVVYNFSGELNDNSISINLLPDGSSLNQTVMQEILVNNQPVKIQAPVINYGNVKLNGNLINENTIEGTWQSTIGTGGNIFLTHQRTSSLNKNHGTNKDKKQKMIFISYSHEDKDHLKRLHVHLKPLQKNGLVNVWDDTKIQAGQKWKEEIELALSKAAIAILIISADFLASDFIIDNELPPILQKAELDGTRILPVILKPCRFSREKNLSQFQALNSPDKPMLAISEIEQEAIWDKLSNIIETEINR